MSLAARHPRTTPTDSKTIRSGPAKASTSALSSSAVAADSRAYAYRPSAASRYRPLCSTSSSAAIVRRSSVIKLFSYTQNAGVSLRRMLSTEDNELLCRVGPGTPMGAFMREYWLPAFLASELTQPDSDPLRL